QASGSKSLDGVGGQTTAGQTGLPAGSVAPNVGDEDSDEDRLALGLDSRRKSGGAKPKQAKRTKDDVKAEELQKLGSEVTSLIESLRFFPEQPTGNSLGRVALDKVERLLKKVDCLRQTSKLAGNMLSTNASTRKKCKAEFITKMEQANQQHQDIFRSFPQSVKNAFQEHLVPALVEKQDWARIAESLSVEFVEELYGVDKAQAQTVVIIEGIVGSVLAKHEGERNPELRGEERAALAAKA
ncbi:unnamed protein product, partial [Symbiodinium sp. CCMP2592]